MIFIIIIIWTLSLLSFFAGLLFGVYFIQRNQVEKVAQTVKRRLDMSPVGVIRRPTQEDIEKKKNPIIEEGKQEFKKLLDTLFNGKNTT